MATPVCYIVNKKIDGFLAAKFGWSAEQGSNGMNPKRICSLRAIYDQNAAEIGAEPLLPEGDVTDDNLEEAYKKLLNFRTGIKEIHRSKLSKGTKKIDRAYDALRHAYSLHERKSRISTLSNLFSFIVDTHMEDEKVGRQLFVNGYTDENGRLHGGEFAILEEVYDYIHETRANWLEKAEQAKNDAYFETYKDLYKKKYGIPYEDSFVGAPKSPEEFRKMCEHRFNEYSKILENWNELIPFVLKDLVKKEGVKLGVKKEYASTATADSFGENDITAKWDMAESKRDGWMENSDLQSSFGSVGQQVRRILATVPQVEMIPDYDIYTDGDGKVVKKYKGMKAISVVDDLGNQQYMDATKTHQALMEFLKGIQDSEHMMERFCKEGKPGEAKIAWMQPIVDVLLSNPQARTQFFCDFKKNFQPYSVMWEDEDEKRKRRLPGVAKFIKTKVLNRPTNILKGKYDIVISPRGKFPANVKMWGKPIFNEDTKEVDWQRLAELRKKVLNWCHEDEIPTIAGQKVWGVSTAPLINNGKNATITIDGKTQALTYEMRREFLMEVFSSLGYDVTVDTIDSILHDRDIFAVREQLEQLFDPKGISGFLYATDKKSINDKNIKDLQEKHWNYRNLYNKEITTKEGQKIKPVKEHSEKLLEIINKHQEGYRIESRARYQGNTMYSFVAPSYLGDRLETIQNYVDTNDKKHLLEFLTTEYLQSPFFVDNEFLATNGQSGRILNTWLADLVNACKDSKIPLIDSVAAIFNYERDLGREDKKFEDFTAREHGIDMLVHFFADEQQKKGYGGKGSKDIRKKLSAMYPVFILGDAGVSKYIRAPRVSSPVWVDKEGKVVDEANGTRHHIEYQFDTEAQNKIIDDFWNIYLQERRRMAMDEVMAYTMYANGKKVAHPKGEFSFLTFLNPTSQEYKDEYAIPTRINAETGKTELDDSEDNIKKIIRQYLTNATKTFKDRLETLGVLETTVQNKKDVYKSINSFATPENIDVKLQEFFWNTKLATAQQLQLMTIDPSFYHGTKDLQKRYKEIHAPGNILDVKAVDFDGELYCPERTIIRNGIPMRIPAGTETAVYFDDLSLNSEEHNPEFMEVILRTFAQAEKEEVEKAIKDGVLKPTPKDNPEYKGLETARKNRLADLLGDNYSIYDTYTANTLTDGQGYRTLESYRRVQGMAGRWTKDMDEAYKAIMEIRKQLQITDASGKVVDYEDATPEQLQKIAGFAMVFQPIKPYMFTHEKYPIKVAKKDKHGNVVMGTNGKPITIDSYQYIPVQHKYAEALIIPELMPKGSKLRDMAFWMDNHNVDMVGSTKIGKVGIFGQCKLDDVKSKEDMNTAMDTAYVHDLPYKDYRIQTNVPEHINSSQLFGTQVRKLIMSGLDLDNAATFYADLLGIDSVNLSTDNSGANTKVPLTGRNLLAFYNSLICANIFDSYDKFAQNAGNIEELSNLLQQSTVGSMREAMDNLFSYVVTGSEKDLQKFMIPLFEGGLEHDAAALILSTFKKIVNKQQISGGSAVQVSAFGINGYEEDGDLRYVQDPDNPANILYAEIEMPFDKSFMVDVRRADGTTIKKQVNLQYEKYCDFMGYMIPSGDPLEKGTKEWKKYQSYTYKYVGGQLVPCKYNDPEAQVFKPLIEKDYPNILSILAYRIPTERDYSMINCQIKRFTSKVAGGTMKVPPEGTSIAGFDFDIDKLYFMQREFHKHYNEKAYTESNFSDAQKYKVWGTFYNKSENREIREALEKARAEAMLRDPEHHAETIIRNGRTITKPKNALNSYWEEAKIEERFNRKKGESFAETAQELGIKPAQNTTNEVVEWMETYDFTKAPEENTRAARNNMLISLIQARLMDPDTVKQRYTPGGFANASKAARLMRELFHGDLTNVVSDSAVDLETLEKRQDKKTDPEPNYDPTDPYTMLVYNQQNQVASKLIGIFANQNTNHAFASSMDTFELNEPIAFCGKSLKDLLHKNSDDAAQIDLNMAEFLAASVDAVKDPVLNFLNLNTLTADAGALLARLGYNTKEIGLLFNQPIIRSVCTAAFNSGSNITSEIDNARRDLLQHLTGVNLDQKVEIGMNDLALGIVNERQMLEAGKTQKDFLAANARMQYEVLELFSNILQASNDVSNFVLNTKFTASNAVSSTFGGMYAQQMKVDNYVDKFPGKKTEKGSLSYTMVVAQGAQERGLMSMPIDNNTALINMSKKEYLHYVRFNPFAYEQAMYDANRKAIKLLSKYFPYDRPMYKRIRDKMSSLARFGTLSEDDINDIHSNIPVALLAMQTRSLFNGEAVHKKGDEETNLTNREYYKERFASDLQDMIAADPDGIGKLEIFKYLTPVSDRVPVLDDKTGQPKKNEDGFPIFKDVWKIQMQDIGGMDADTKEAVRESWAYLMEVNDSGHFKSKELKDLGRDLFMYCFYQLGFDFSPLSFMHLAPTAVKDGIMVEREESLYPAPFDGDPKPDSDDVMVWSDNVFGAAELASDKFYADRSVVGELVHNSFQLPEELDRDAFIALIHEAKSHPELKFKICRDLEQEEIDLLNNETLKEDIPSNIYFTKWTLQNASPESIEAMSYGKSRTYRQFLNEILDGTEDELNSDEFAQMFILNHLDNTRFVMDTSIGSKRLREIIREQTSQPGNTLMVGTEFRKSIVLDVSKYQNDRDKEALSNLADVVEQEGQIIQVTWCPCIKIGDSYYMAESGTEKFNVKAGSAGVKMTYRKVIPWGSSKTIKYDNGEELAPTMRYQSSMNAMPQRNLKYTESKNQTSENIQDNTTPEAAPEPLTDQPNGNAKGLNAMRQSLEDAIFDDYIEGLKMRDQSAVSEAQIENIRKAVKAQSFDDLMDTVNDLRKACRKNGVLMLDDQGNPMQGC